MCLGERKFAGKYDWVMVNDIDEYLWFTDHIGVKEFLSRQPAHFTYMSLPKRMYTLDHRTDFEAKNHKIDMTQLNEFAVSQYPFYVDDFCYHMGRNRGNPFCPTWRGRAKVIVRPRFHTKIDVHGNIANPNPENGTIHFSKDQARFMEWPAVFAKHNVTKRNTADFFVLEEDDVHIHNLARGFKADKNGMFRLQHDKDLKDWFHFVKGRFGNR